MKADDFTTRAEMESMTQEEKLKYIDHVSSLYRQQWIQLTSIESVKAFVQKEITELLDIPYEITEVPYEEGGTRAAIVYIARSPETVIVWEFDVASRQFTFEMRRDGYRFQGEGASAREAFTSKKKQFRFKLNQGV